MLRALDASINPLLLREISTVLKEAHKMYSLFTQSPSVSYQSNRGDTWSAFSQPCNVAGKDEHEEASQGLERRGGQAWRDCFLLAFTCSHRSKHTQILTGRYKPGLRTATSHVQDDNNTIFSSLCKASEALPCPPSSNELLPSPTSAAKVSELSQGYITQSFFFFWCSSRFPFRYHW